jgi:hypothetical protein
VATRSTVEVSTRPVTKRDDPSGATATASAPFSGAAGLSQVLFQSLCPVCASYAIVWKSSCEKPMVVEPVTNTREPSGLTAMAVGISSPWVGPS